METHNPTPLNGPSAVTSVAEPAQAIPVPASNARASGDSRFRRSVLMGPLPWLVMAAALAADQISKALVIANLTYRTSWPDEGFFRFTHTSNTGTAFGLFQGYGGALTVVSLAAVVVLYIFYRSTARTSVLMRVAFGLQLGGAFGNLIDRVRLGHVTDFIDVGPWPVFNLADSSIVIGIALMAYYFWSDRNESHAETGSTGPAGQPGNS